MEEQAMTRRAMRIANDAMRQLRPFEKLKAARDALYIPDEPDGQLWRVNREAILWFRAFVNAGGLVLDPKVWRTDNGAATAVSNAVEGAIVQGMDASKAAAGFMYDGPGNDVMHTTQYGDEMDQAELLLRSLINLVHGSAYMAGAEQTRGFGGFRYLLSPRHCGPDVCDLLAAQNRYGLGAGVYPGADLCPWPAHLGTLSYVEMVFDEEVTASDREGKETSLQALARLPAEVREGVLGPTKARYFDAGLLKPWMIRSPLEVVQNRLVRQNLIDGNALESDPDPDEYEDDC
jgi:hypothetical protein